MSKLLVCKACSAEFNPFVYIDGIRIARYRRKYCEACAKNRPNKHNHTLIDGERQCKTCKKDYSILCFSATKAGHRRYECKRCYTNKQQTTRQRLKLQCVTYKGGKCERCGYNKCSAAFDFHHKDQTKKDFQISRITIGTLTDNLKKELDKCELLCANCHREEHYQI